MQQDGRARRQGSAGQSRARKGRVGGAKASWDEHILLSFLFSSFSPSILFLWLLIFVLDPINIVMIRTALRRPGTLSEVAMRLVLTKVPSTVLVLNHEGPLWLQYRNSRITRRYSSIGSLWFRVSSL